MPTPLTFRVVVDTATGNMKAKIATVNAPHGLAVFS